MATGNHKLLELHRVCTLPTAPRGFFAPDATDSVYQGAVKVFAFPEDDADDGRVPEAIRLPLPHTGRANETRGYLSGGLCRCASSKKCACTPHLVSASSHGRVGKREIAQETRLLFGPRGAPVNRMSSLRAIIARTDCPKAKRIIRKRVWRTGKAGRS